MGGNPASHMGQTLRLYSETLDAAIVNNLFVSERPRFTYFPAHSLVLLLEFSP